MTTFRAYPLAALLAAGVLNLAGCATGQSGSDYTRDEVRREQTVRLGVVDSVREVQIEGTRSGIGPGAGAVIGGIAGSNVGHGSGSAVGAIVGAVVGGIAGQAIEEDLSRRPGLEITVKLDSGQLVAITQAAGNESFSPGDRVRVLSDGRTARVTR